jgi:hypothetical protein
VGPRVGLDMVAKRKLFPEGFTVSELILNWNRPGDLLVTDNINSVSMKTTNRLETAAETTSGIFVYIKYMI